MNKENTAVTIDKIVSDNHAITENVLISEAINEQFSSFAERHDLCDSNLKELGIQNSLCQFILRHIRPSKVFSAIDNLKNGNQSSGVLQ